MVTDQQLVALTTLFRHGSEDASLALSRWLGRPSRISVEQVEQVPLSEATEVLGDAERPVCFCVMDFKGRVTGTTDALMEGAFDFIHKPSGSDAGANRKALAAALREKIEIFRDSRKGRLVGPRSAPPLKPPLLTQPAPDSPGCRPFVASTKPPVTECEAVLIGTSTGGPVALREVLTHLPGDLPVPILIVQHMPAQYTHSLAQRLNEASPLEVVEACDGMTLEPGWAFLAPGGRQMKVVRRGIRNKIQITDDPPESGVRPSVDYLFRSAVEVFGGKVVAVVMTGMGRDGTEGCRELKRRGAYVIAQHADGCVVYGMPKALVDEQLADRIVPLHQIAGAVLERLGSLSGGRQKS